MKGNSMDNPNRNEIALNILSGMIAHSRNGHGYVPRHPGQHWHISIVEEAFEIADEFIKQSLKKDT